MQALALDYQRKLWPARSLGFIVFVLGVLAVLGVGLLFVGVQQQREELEPVLARLEKKRAPARHDLTERERARLAEEVKLAESIAERLNLPWTELFQALEGSSSPDIALLALEPDAPRKALRITAEARSKKDMLEYIERLTNDQTFVGVHVIDHQLQTQTPGEPVRFSIQASWEALKKRED